MTLSELRGYLADPAKDGNPAIEAARAAVRERDQMAELLSSRADDRLQYELLRRQVNDLEADRETCLKKIAELRAEVVRLTPAPWEK